MRPTPTLLVVILSCLLASPAVAETQSMPGTDAVQDCYLQEISQAAPEMTIAELRALCDQGGSESGSSQPDLMTVKKEEPVASFSQRWRP